MKKCDKCEFVEVCSSLVGVKICENCEHYTPIDSGYGYCKANPPVMHAESIFPIVPWCFSGCGRYE